MKTTKDKLLNVIKDPEKIKIINDNMVTCYGLLRCQNGYADCKTIHNRDKNAVTNMLNIIYLQKETVYCMSDKSGR